jgi:HEAT repeat protein
VLRSDGEPISKEIYVNDKRLYAFELGIPTRFHGGLGISLAEDGSFVVVWRAFGEQTCSRFKIVARRFGPAGQPLGKEFLVDGDGRGAQLAPAVGHAENGSFVVSWTAGWRYGLADQSIAVWVKRFGPKGTPLAAATQLSEVVAGGMLPPALAVADDGSFAVAWLSGDLFTEAIPTGSINLQLATSDGHPNGRVTEVTGAAEALADPPAVASVPGHGFLVTMVSGQPKPAGSIVVGQMVQTDGRLSAEPFVISQPTCRSSRRPGLSVGANGTAVAVWEYSWDAAIHALRFSAMSPDQVIATESPGTSLLDRLDEAVATLDDPMVRSNRQAAVRTLTCLMTTAHSALPTASRCLHNQTESSVRALCATAVASIAADEEQAVDALVHSLKKKESPTVRARVVRALGSLEEVASRAIPMITDALSDPSAEVRAAAFDSLARLQGQTAIPAIEKLFKNDPELEVRIDAAALLCQLEKNEEKRRRALRSLVYWTENAKMERHRFRALLRLTRLELPPQDTLVAALELNQERFIKLRILRALGRIEHQLNPQTAGLIFPYALTWDHELRQAAIDALLPKFADDGKIHKAISSTLKRFITYPDAAGDRSAHTLAVDFLYRCGSAELQRHEAELRRLLEKVGGPGAKSAEGALETIDEEDLCFGDSDSSPVTAAPGAAGNKQR